MFHPEIEMQDNHIKIILHVGAHKSASTHLQNRLLEDENLLGKRAVRIWGRKEFVSNLVPYGGHWADQIYPRNKKVNLRPWQLVGHAC